MSILDEMNKTLSEFPGATSDPEELHRLNQFLMEMKRAGVAKTQKYSIPLPDTLGRVLLNNPRQTER